MLKQSLFIRIVLYNYRKILWRIVQYKPDISNKLLLDAMSTLFCTSTIVEGVNTNAKTVVVYNNPSGKTNEGKKFLLLNINGRAGRYQHHFIGNIAFWKSVICWLHILVSLLVY